MLSRAEVAERVPEARGKWVGGTYSDRDGKAEPALAAPAIAGGPNSGRHDPPGMRRAGARLGQWQDCGRAHGEGLHQNQRGAVRRRRLVLAVP